MAQDDLNNQTNLANPQVATEVLDEPSQPANSNEPVADSVGEVSPSANETESETTSALANETLEDESNSEEEDDAAEVAEPDHTTKSPSDSSATPAVSIPSANTADAQADDRSTLERQPYAFDHCTVQIAIQLLADDGDPNGRMVVVGVRSHLDAPILRVVRWNEIGPLPPIVNTLLDELKAELPAREQAAREQFEKKQAEKAKRQSTVAPSKTSARGKKSKATTLATSPTANAAVIDNRPRPEVDVTSASQRQMGLF